jgi:hypothetical protein
VLLNVAVRAAGGLAVVIACGYPVAAQTRSAPAVASISVKVVQVRGPELSAVVVLPAVRARKVVRIRTTSATTVWEGDVRHGAGRIKAGDDVFARGAWLPSGDFSASYLVVDLVNEYGVAGSVRPTSLRLRLVDRNSLEPLLPARYDTVRLNAHTRLNGRPQRNIEARIRAGSLIQVIGVRTSANAVNAVNVLPLTVSRPAAARGF